MNALLPLIGSSGGKYHCASVVKAWDPAAIARHLCLDQESEGQMTLNVKDATILSACVHDLAEFRMEQVLDLTSVFQDLRPLLLPALADSETCGVVVNIFCEVAFNTTSDELNVLEGQEMMASLIKIVSEENSEPAKDDERTFHVTRMLREIGACNAQNARYVRQVLEELADVSGSAFPTSAFATLLQEIAFN